eukprot:TRINITY_DN60633_c0_g1_i1.p1 TRINITY_DN60633_c0_g1~~TRINITY_DN60633_c0_g1_i1.p1  ORF type:complete len:259 (-),score=26.50 TRINITY_DN60633_c0_g1_i1:110-844(-)
MQHLSMVSGRGINDNALVWFLKFIWFIQRVFVPFFFVIAAPQLLAIISSTLDVIFNTLAVTFVLEIDDILYASLLSNAEKKEYEDSALQLLELQLRHGSSLPVREKVSKTSWGLYWVSVSIMLVYFFALRLSNKEAIDTYFVSWQHASYFAFLNFALRGAILITAWSPQGSGGFLSMLKWIGLGAFSMVCCWVWWYALSYPFFDHSGHSIFDDLFLTVPLRCMKMFIRSSSVGAEDELDEAVVG